jgi:hypothetical protein
MAKENKKLVSLLEDWQECVWIDFHNGNVNNEEDFEENYNNFINDKTIYDYDCNEILVDNLDYCFHPQANDIRSAAIECLYDYFANESHKDDMWREMEEVLNED